MNQEKQKIIQDIQVFMNLTKNKKVIQKTQNQLTDLENLTTEELTLILNQVCKHYKKEQRIKKYLLPAIIAILSIIVVICLFIKLKSKAKITTEKDPQKGETIKKYYDSDRKIKLLNKFAPDNGNIIEVIEYYDSGNPQISFKYDPK